MVPTRINKAVYEVPTRIHKPVYELPTRIIKAVYEVPMKINKTTSYTRTNKAIRDVYSNEDKQGATSIRSINEDKIRRYTQHQRG